MTFQMLAPLVAIAVALTACSGGGSPGASAGTALPKSTQQTSTGTLSVALPQVGVSSNARKAASSTRKPNYVSTSTTYATLWIDGSTTGNRVACNGQAGQCTINWTSTSGSHTFAVALDDSSSVSGGGYVLAENSLNFMLGAGSGNTLSMNLNGVVATVQFASENLLALGASDCGQGENCFDVFLYALDWDGNIITSPGGIDNGDLDISSTLVLSFGSSTGTNFLTTETSNGMLEDSNFNCPGDESVTQSMTLSAQTGYESGQTNGEVTSSQLATYSLNYPNQSNIALENWPTYNCLNGQISAVGPANGSITVTSHSHK